MHQTAVRLGIGQGIQVRGMRERSVGIRELKSKPSECVREVKRGGTLVVTEHGRRFARLVPKSDSLGGRLDILKKAGTMLRRPPTRPCNVWCAPAREATVADTSWKIAGDRVRRCERARETVCH